MSRLLALPRVRDAILGAALLCAAAALMLWPKEAMEAARDGLTLCANVIVPSLFPFFVLSSLVVELGLAGYLGKLLEGVMRPLFRVGGPCASAVALGFIGGYPVGARTALSLYQKGLCTRTEAQRLLAFCNNSGPAFILGVVGAGVFASSRVGVLLCLAHALASVCVGVLFRFYPGDGKGRRGGGAPAAPRFQARRFTAVFTGAVKNSFLSTLNICAFVIFFTVVLQMLVTTGVLPGMARLLGLLLSPLGLTEEWARRLLTGLVEISSGVWTLAGEGTFRGRLTMAAFLLGWAGLSVHCQVLSFLGDSGLSARTYLAGKLLHGGLSALFVALLVRFLPLEAPVSDYLAQQVADIASAEFSTALALSVASAWLVFLVFFFLAAASRKGLCKRRRGVL